MDKYKETFETWNKIAKLYEEKFMNLDLYNESYDLICSSLKGDKAKVLDLACGPGNIAKYILSKCPRADVLGVDIAPNMIQLAKENNPRANFLLKDIREINELKDSFDAIVCGFCLPYLSTNDMVKLLQDSAALLNKEGLLYLSFVEGNPDDSGFIKGSGGDRSYFYYHQSKKIQGVLLENGFIKIERSIVSYNKTDVDTELHTIITAIKKNI